MFVLCIAACVCSARAPSQQDYKLKVSVQEVTLDARIFGNIVGELRRADFTIYDNGIVQEITHFSYDILPIAVALVIDSSPSIEPYIKDLRTAASLALANLKAEDQVVLFSFSSQTRRHSNLTSDRVLISQLINDLAIGSGTDITDAVAEAAHFLNAATENRRKAIILISDNDQTVPGISPDAAAMEVLEDGVTLCSIQTHGSSTGENVVQKIARETGGDIVDANTAGSVTYALTATIANLRTQYSLAFVPSDPGKEGEFRRLTVKISAGDRCPGCRVRARTGYYPGVPRTFRTSDYIPDGSGPMPREESEAFERIIAVASESGEYNEIPTRIGTARVKDASGAAQTRVDLKIDAGAIGFKELAGDRYAAKLRVAIFIADEKGIYLGNEWRWVNAELSAEEYRHSPRSAVPFSTLIPLKRPKELLKIILYDPETGKICSKVVKT